MVTDLVPATEPAKVTRPVAGALTGSPSFAAKSTPQWPEYWPFGEYGSITTPFTGAEMQTAAMAITKNNSTSPAVNVSTENYDRQGVGHYLGPLHERNR